MRLFCWIEVIGLSLDGIQPSLVYTRAPGLQVSYGAESRRSFVLVAINKKLECFYCEHPISVFSCDARRTVTYKTFNRLTVEWYWAAIQTSVLVLLDSPCWQKIVPSETLTISLEKVTAQHIRINLNAVTADGRSCAPSCLIMIRFCHTTQRRSARTRKEFVMSNYTRKCRSILAFQHSHH